MKKLLWGLVGGTAVFIIVIALEVYRFGEQDQTVSADAAIVLGAAVFRERPSPVFRERINHAILLYNQDYIDTIIFTGGLGTRDRLTEAEVGRLYALEQGIPNEAILIETTSTNTQENLHHAQQIATSYNLNSFLIVSTPFHMKRAIAIADELEMEAYSSPTRTIQWISWRTRTQAYLREVIAYLSYLLLG